MGERKRWYTIDFLRVIFTVCVIIGHTYRIFYRVDGEFLISMQNMSVDAFFIISGMFLANSVNKLPTRDTKAFALYLINRAKRLFPTYFLVAILTLFYRVILGQNQSLLAYCNIFLLLDEINTFPMLVTGAWYISALFWMSMVITYILYIDKKRAVVFYLPFTIFLTLSVMYSKWDHLSLNKTPLVFDIFSAGLIKALLGLAIGVEVYFASKYLKPIVDSINNKSVVRVLLLLVEMVSVVGISYCFVVGGNQPSNYYIYFFLPPLLIIIFMEKEILLHFGNLKIWSVLGSYTYAIYLVHPLLLNIIKEQCDWYVYFPQSVFYFLSCVVSIGAGILIQRIVNRIDLFCTKILR